MTILPTNAIPRYCTSDLATDGDKRAGKSRRSNSYVKNPAAVDTAGPDQRTNLFAKSGIGLTHRTRPSPRSNAQAFATFTPSVIDDGAAARRAPSFTETMLVFAFPVVGLECAFHRVYLLNTGGSLT